MTADPYSERVRELFAKPRHAGILDGPSVYHEDQGIRLLLSARVRRYRLESLRFQAYGCPHLIAAAEAFCADYEGRPTDELDGYSAIKTVDELAVPAEKTGRILVLEDAVRSLGAKCR